MGWWPEGWTKPRYVRRRGPFKAYLSPLTRTKAGGSYKLGPVSITSTGRVYFDGAYLFGGRDR